MNFTPTTAGLDYAEINVMDAASGVQIYQGTLGRFYVAVPGSVRTTGIRVISGHATFADALSAAPAAVAKQAARMAKLHAAALKMNAARA